ncbi:MAG: SsrA-binding protein SmpB [Rhodobacteraceae bacterium]|nr:SsrA-binding protein SmpB [Paracoccaceae bacterium]
MSTSSKEKNHRVLAANRRARYDYEVHDEIECGVALLGSEVKSLRTGKATIAESYAAVEDGELWLINSSIAAYANTGAFRHDERRKRKLLVRRKELAKLWSATRREGLTLVPLVMYFNGAGRVKIKLAVARGKKRFDKRQVEKRRDWGREKARLLRQSG